MELALHKKLSISLYPESILATKEDKRVAAHHEVAKAALEDAVAFATLNYRLQGLLVDAPEPGKYAAATFKKIFESFDKRFASIGKRREAIAAAIDAAVLTSNQKPYHAELRAHFKSHSVSERAKLIMDALNSHDTTFIAAILEAPHQTTGLTADQQAAYRRIAEQKWAPQDVAARKVVDTILDKLNLMKSLTDSAAAKLIPPEPVKSKLEEALA